MMLDNSSNDLIW